MTNNDIYIRPIGTYKKGTQTSIGEQTAAVTGALGNAPKVIKDPRSRNTTSL